MGGRRGAAVASCGWLLVLCAAACSGEPVVVAGRASAAPSAPSPAPTDAVPVGDPAETVEAAVVVEGTFDGDLAFCRQRGSVTVQLAQRGDVVRGEFSGPAPAAAPGDETCDDQPEMTGYWEIDVSDPAGRGVVACVVNGTAADTAILFPRDAGIEVECTRAGAGGGLLETTFLVDL